jgi:hypothetical protein
MTDDMDVLSARMNRNPAADVKSIDEARRQLGAAAPADYFVFMSRMNGGEGMVGDASYLAIWRIEDIARLNREYQVHEFAPTLIVFGSDGGDIAYAFRAGETGPCVCQTPFIGMSETSTVMIADSFVDFLRVLRRRRN